MSAFSLTISSEAHSQSAAAAMLSDAVSGLRTPVRVLMIGAHPDDEDTNLLAWLARGRDVETAYLSLTRGDGGQNLIGNELGEALGIIRTEELLAARRIDGAQQFFTRAYDFGYSKSVDETLAHWPKDSILRDVVTVVRSFRPHIVVGVFSGTPRDGHGHHQVSGILAREAYDLAADTARFPRAATAGHGGWLPLKFYRAARFRPEAGTVAANVGELDPVRGVSYAELAARSRSQHKSQGFGVLERRGALLDWVRREASRVDAPEDPTAERSMFAGIDTTWRRLRPLARDAVARAAIDSLDDAVRAADAALDLRRPWEAIPALARVKRLLLRAWCGEPGTGCVTDGVDPIPERNPRLHPDLERSLLDARGRVDRALLLAAGVVVEATADRSEVAVGDSVEIEIAVFNRGEAPIVQGSLYQVGDDVRPAAIQLRRAVPILPDSARRYAVTVQGMRVTRAPWLAEPRAGDVFGVPGSDAAEPLVAGAARILVELEIGGVKVWGNAPVVHRYADPVRGTVERPLVVVPAVSLRLDRTVEYARAGAPYDRSVRVDLRSGSAEPRDLTVALRLPRGLAADSASRRIELAPFASEVVEFRVQGTLPAGEHEIAAVANAGGATYDAGYQPIEYDHITPRRIWRDAEIRVQAVDVTIPAGLDVAYVPGVGDNVAPMLRQLGIPVTVVEPSALPAADLSRHSAVVIGPRAYDAHEPLLRSAGRLLEYARRGGTLVVQYGQYEMTRPGVMPYPITLDRPARRVTVEQAPVRLLRPDHPLLRNPNRITAGDFEGWVQERGLYMPSTFDPRYTAVVATSDPGEPPVESGLLVAPVGQGLYVYAPLSFFRQLPAGVPGAARLFVNLLAATPSAAGVAAP